MRRAMIILVAVGALAWLAWKFVPFQVYVWDGAFELTVQLESNVAPIKTVSCLVAGNEEADHLLANVPSPAQQFVGQPLTISVPCGGRCSQSGRDLYRYQYPLMVVVADLQDGTRVWKRVEIPDSRISREVKVSLP